MLAIILYLCIDNNVSLGTLRKGQLTVVHCTLLIEGLFPFFWLLNIALELSIALTHAYLLSGLHIQLP